MCLFCSVLVHGYNQNCDQTSYSWATQPDSTTWFQFWNFEINNIMNYNYINYNFIIELRNELFWKRIAKWAFYLDQYLIRWFSWVNERTSGYSRDLRSHLLYRSRMGWVAALWRRDRSLLRAGLTPSPHLAALIAAGSPWEPMFMSFDLLNCRVTENSEIV